MRGVVSRIQSYPRQIYRLACWEKRKYHETNWLSVDQCGIPRKSNNIALYGSTVKVKPRVAAFVMTARMMPDGNCPALSVLPLYCADNSKSNYRVYMP